MRSVSPLLFVLVSVFALLLALPAVAQDAPPAPAPAPAPEAAPPANAVAGDATSAAVVTFFTGLTETATTNASDCAQMGNALNAYLDSNTPMLRDAAYSASIASATEEAAILSSATELGEAAGACYQVEGVNQFFQRFVAFASELDR